MYVQSTNIAIPKTITWHDKPVETGIYKTPTPKAIYLGKTGVKNDFIGDTRVHGGTHKACYLFSTDHYPYWKKLYPDLDWNWGLFGENLTINGLNETQVMVGAIYKVGNALIQITQPREPCFKFGVKFGSQDIISKFIAHGFPGTYAKVLEEGYVETNATLKLVDEPDRSLSVKQLFQLIFSRNKNADLLDIAINNDALPSKLKTILSR